MTQRRYVSWLWQRDLTAYPKGPLRWGLLFLVTAGGICLTSLGLVIGSISPLLIGQTGMSTDFYSYLLVVAGLFGANIGVFQTPVFSWFDFITGYLMIPGFILFYLGHKFWRCSSDSAHSAIALWPSGLG